MIESKDLKNLKDFIEKSLNLFLNLAEIKFQAYIKTRKKMIFDLIANKKNFTIDKFWKKNMKIMFNNNQQLLQKIDKNLIDSFEVYIYII